MEELDAKLSKFSTIVDIANATVGDGIIHSLKTFEDEHPMAWAALLTNFTAASKQLDSINKDVDIYYSNISIAPTVPKVNPKDLNEKVIETLSTMIPLEDTKEISKNITPNNWTNHLSKSELDTINHHNKRIWSIIDNYNDHYKQINKKISKFTK